MIYHITTPEEFSKFNNKNFYESASLASEGFIHCSTLKQLKPSIERHFSDSREIVILYIDERKLKAVLKYEMAESGEEFPHIYGPINREAIAEIKNYSKWLGSFDIET